MSFYTCEICGEQFESDWHSGTPKYCGGCKEMPSGSAIVYGLHNGDGVIRYVGSTTTPVQRLMTHRYPDNYEKKQPDLAAWVRESGPHSIHMVILRRVETSERLKHEERERRQRTGLVNMRRAAQRAMSKEEARAALRAYFDS